MCFFDCFSSKTSHERPSCWDFHHFHTIYRLINHLKPSNPLESSKSWLVIVTLSHLKSTFCISFVCTVNSDRPSVSLVFLFKDMILGGFPWWINAAETWWRNLVRYGGPECPNKTCERPLKKLRCFTLREFFSIWVGVVVQKLLNISVFNLRNESERCLFYWASVHLIYINISISVYVI